MLARLRYCSILSAHFDGFPFKTKRHLQPSAECFWRGLLNYLGNLIRKLNNHTVAVQFPEMLRGTRMAGLPGYAAA
jgi:hypothetical protein